VRAFGREHYRLRGIYSQVLSGRQHDAEPCGSERAGRGSDLCCRE
jgi:hypothetical protein